MQAQRSTGGAALVAIDLQNGFLHPDGSMAALGRDVSRLADLIPRIEKLLSAVRLLGVPILYTKHAYRTGYPEGGRQLAHVRGLSDIGGLLERAWDAEFVDQLAPGAADVVVVKRRYDAFLGTDLELLLRSLGIERLYVAGVATNMCVESTVRSASQRDFAVTVVSDCTGAPDPQLHDASLRAMAYAFADVTPMDQALAQLELEPQDPSE